MGRGKIKLRFDNVIKLFAMRIKFGSISLVILITNHITILY